MTLPFDPVRRAPPSWLVAPLLHRPVAVVTQAAPRPVTPDAASLPPPTPVAPPPIVETPRRSTALRVDGGGDSSTFEHRPWNMRAWE